MYRSGPRQSDLSGNVSLAGGVPGALLTAVVLIAGATLTWLAWRATLQAEEQHSRDELALQAAAIESGIENRLLAYEGLLRAGAGAINAFWPITSAQWKQFAAELQLASVYPGTQGIGFATRVDTAERFAYWSGVLRAHGAGAVPLRQPGSGQLPQTAIVFLEPLDRRNRQAIGYDMMSEPTRRRAMERARDANAAALSGKVVLVQDSRLGGHTPGFLLYLPVYSTVVAPTTLDARRRALRGYVYSPFRAGDFFGLAAIPGGSIVEVFDGRDASAGALLFRNQALTAGTRLTDTRRISVAGHEWTLRVSPAAAGAAEGQHPAILIAASGTAITLLLAAIVTTLSLSRQRLHERIRADGILAQRERQAAQVLENALDAYISIDTNDVIVEWNRQASALFGWSAGEAIGRRLSETIVPPQLRREHLQGVARAGRRREDSLVGRRMEMPALRKDGSELLIELSIIRVHSPAGLRFSASLRDITQLRRKEAEIRELNESLEQRVIERTAQLELANRELLSANRDLEAFTYSVSHDLRAPLRAIDGHVALLVGQAETMSEVQRHHSGAVRRNVARMNRLIEDLLNFAFVGRRPLQKQRIAVWDLVRPILQEVQSPTPVVFEFDPAQLGEAQADPALLGQVLRNLIFNAVKFSRDAVPPRIGIGSELRGEERVWFVRDNGVGFDMQHASRLFGVFERMHTEKEFDGTGVGLAIVKQIIERHGGRVWAEAGPGRGATFYFTLPG